jgi:hypothetical protein
MFCSKTAAKPCLALGAILINPIGPMTVTLLPLACASFSAEFTFVFNRTSQPSRNVMYEARRVILLKICGDITGAVGARDPTAFICGFEMVIAEAGDAITRLIGANNTK